MSRRLRVVDDAYINTPRVYVVGIDGFDFANDVAAMDNYGYIVINGDEDRAVDEVSLREHIRALADADFLMLPDIWWTSTIAHQLVMIAGWLDIAFCNQFGTQIETVSAMGSGR